MTDALESSALQELAARLEFYRELGIYDFYRRGEAHSAMGSSAPAKTEAQAAMPAAWPAPASSPSPDTVLPDPVPEESNIPRRTLVSNQPVPALVSFGPVLPAAQRPAALAAITDLIGDCQRCRLAQGRNKIVFADGDANGQLMFVGEGPGADEDAQGLPFVGRAGQLLNNMINAMGLKREQVYIANVVKCRPPGNRTPEPEEANTCMPFLQRQIDVVKPEVLVALGATAATYLLGQRQPLAGLRGRMHSVRGSRLIVTYHPA